MSIIYYYNELNVFDSCLETSIVYYIIYFMFYVLLLTNNAVPKYSNSKNHHRIGIVLRTIAKWWLRDPTHRHLGRRINEEVPSELRRH